MTAAFIFLWTRVYNMDVISDPAFAAALAQPGLRAPSAAPARAASRVALSQLVFKVARRLLDTLAVTSNQRTLQPEHLHNLARIASLLDAPIAVSPARQGPANRRGMLLMRGGNGGTTMPGSFFNPADAADASSYSAANIASFSPSFPAAGPGTDGMVRYALDVSPAFAHPAEMLGGGIRSRHWLTDDAIAAVMREYRARSASSDGLRVSEAARGMVRTVVEANVGAALSAVAKRARKAGGDKGKKPVATAAALSAAAGKWVLAL